MAGGSRPCFGEPHETWTGPARRGRIASKFRSEGVQDLLHAGDLDGLVGLGVAGEAVGGGLECKDAFIDLNIALGQRRARDVFCPAGTVAVSGGATATINTGLYINASGPTSGLDIDSNKWFTSVENYSSPTNGIGPSVRFYARCCRVVP